MQRCEKVVPSGEMYRGRGFCTGEGGGTLPKHSENWVGEGEMRSAGKTPSGVGAGLSGAGDAQRSREREGKGVLVWKRRGRWFS